MGCRCSWRLPGFSNRSPDVWTFLSLWKRIRRWHPSACVLDNLAWCPFGGVFLPRRWFDGDLPKPPGRAAFPVFPLFFQISESRRPPLSFHIGGLGMCRGTTFFVFFLKENWAISGEFSGRGSPPFFPLLPVLRFGTSFLAEIFSGRGGFFF